ncbi:hypothetical protein WJX81_001112 [Elliptochloris bilobata]|uniref:Uncharacterized protein n=1 Tax=Elliptochloris bilobata TaxID=381761 RepID=A0AAW1RVZ5_9CHLO
MVPLGSAAFLPGRLADASKCLVRVGDMLVERSADEARTGVLRRAAALRAEGEAAAGELASLIRRLEVAEAAVLAPLQAAVGDCLVDICEEYNEAVHGPSLRPQHVPTARDAAPSIAEAHPSTAAANGVGSVAGADSNAALFAHMEALARREEEEEERGRGGGGASGEGPGYLS